VPMERSEPRIVVITGGTKGVGRAVTRRFARAGYDVAVLARGSEALHATQHELSACGVRALALRVDVANPAEVHAAAQRIEQELGPIAIWINNAMTTVYGRVDQLSAEEFRRVTDVTYHGYVWGTQAALACMRPRNLGVILQVGSSLAYRGIGLQAAYCGAKHAIRGFTDSLRTELLHDGIAIHLCMVQLPAINTPQFDHALNKLPRAPQPVPPIYQPEVAANAIYYAAHHRHRELYVSPSTLKTVLSQKVVPGLVDRIVARSVLEGEMSDEPARGGPSNLFEAVDDGSAARGRFNARARSRDPFTAITKHLGGTIAGALPIMAMVAGMAVLGGALAARLSRDGNPISRQPSVR
jgi:NAD(P)-dependent dehydrogenase (short-subunit alcohol dehydrogenase family)